MHVCSMATNMGVEILPVAYVEYRFLSQSTSYIRSNLDSLCHCPSPNIIAYHEFHWQGRQLGH